MTSSGASMETHNKGISRSNKKEDSTARRALTPKGKNRKVINNQRDSTLGSERGGPSKSDRGRLGGHNQLRKEHSQEKQGHAYKVQGPGQIGQKHHGPGQVHHGYHDHQGQGRNQSEYGRTNNANIHSQPGHESGHHHHYEQGHTDRAHIGHDIGHSLHDHAHRHDHGHHFRVLGHHDHGYGQGHHDHGHNGLHDHGHHGYGYSHHDHVLRHSHPPNKHDSLSRRTHSTISGNHRHYYGDRHGNHSNIEYENTYKIGPECEADVAQIREIIRAVLEDNLTGKTYDPLAMQTESRILSDLIKDKIKAMNLFRFKLVCIVLIGEGKAQSMQIASRCLWDQHYDNFATATVRMDDFYAIGIVFVTYFE